MAGSPYALWRNPPPDVAHARASQQSVCRGCFQQRLLPAPRGPRAWHLPPEPLLLRNPRLSHTGYGQELRFHKIHVLEFPRAAASSVFRSECAVTGDLTGRPRAIWSRCLALCWLLSTVAQMWARGGAGWGVSMEIAQTSTPRGFWDTRGSVGLTLEALLSRTPRSGLCFLCSIPCSQDAACPHGPHAMCLFHVCVPQRSGLLGTSSPTPRGQCQAG